MEFEKQLNEYIHLLNCSSKELSQSSGLSAVTIGRYRSGERIPSKDSTQLQKLINGLANLSLQKGITSITKESLSTSFNETLRKSSINYEQLCKNFNTIISILKINIAEMSRALNFDASYISRIRTGKRKPADSEFFVSSVCKFIIHRYISKTEKKNIANLIDCTLEDIENKTIYLEKLINWFYTNTVKDNNINNFLKKLDEFNLNEYIRIIHFDELKVPSVPFQFPTSKNYYGIEQMKHAELDFFKATVFSKSTEPIFMCSDMPIEDIGRDIDFGKKWMFAIAMVLKKGLNLNIIHNVERPFNEMMLGLESWIPIYMTGQITPYYLKSTPNNVYNHFNYVSGNVALTGECISGFHDKGKYYLTNNKEEVSYYKEKALCLLKKAQPLMNIYTKYSANIYNAFINSESHAAGKRHNILSSIPIYTITNELLNQILDHNSIFDEDRTKILDFLSEQKNTMNTILDTNNVLDEITELSESEFNKYPISLSLSGMFYENKVYYTYSEYLKHLELTKTYSNLHNNYTVKTHNKNAFRNIEISINENKWVMISKNTAPAIHFVIKHSKLCTAIKNFIAPIEE